MPPKRKTSRDASPTQKDREEKTVYVVSRGWGGEADNEGLFDNMDAAKDCIQFLIRDKKTQWTEKHESYWHTHTQWIEIQQHALSGSLSSWKASRYPDDKD